MIFIGHFQPKPFYNSVKYVTSSMGPVPALLVVHCTGLVEASHSLCVLIALLAALLLLV